MPYRYVSPSAPVPTRAGALAEHRPIQMADLDLARLILVIVISAGALDVHRQSTFAQNRARAFLASTFPWQVSPSHESRPWPMPGRALPATVSWRRLG